ncbi:alpha/beta fold hydrolase [Sorangium sp. So ce131]|uniref:alpha/beta fold hydrolase n=1 Tax=Sorangium sp. So ce131 TaxID=3133282 RepID=UPI003F5F5A34
MSMPAALRRNNVRVVGDGERTVVLAHGFGTDQTAWRHQAAALARTHRVVLFDHVGAGGSDLTAYSPQRYRSLHSYSADVLEVLAEVSPEAPVDYVGHSMSGMIGLLAGIAEPARFRSMAFIDASPCYVDGDGYVGGFSQASLDGFLDAMASNYHAWVSGFAGVAARNPERPEVAEEFARGLGAIRPDIALSVARLIWNADHRGDLAALAVPTLILQAQDDIAVPVVVGRYLADHIPRARLAVIDAYGHLPHLSAPEAVNEALRRFLG